VDGGNPQLTSEFLIDGLPIRIPMLDINTVGAGGGSIVRIDEGGMLQVGPTSAGADPGPACYGRGGAAATVTDAQVLRGAIRKETFLGGTMDIDRDQAEAALAPIAEGLGQSLEAAADSAVQVANANIVRAIQLITTERGKDPRDFVIVAFGGAGPLHAAQVAAELGVRQVLVPPNAGVVSAFGLLSSDFVLFESRTRVMVLSDDTMKDIRADVETMVAQLQARFGTLGFDRPPQCRFTFDMRNVGQAFEVPVTFDAAAFADLDADGLRQRFVAAHESIFYHGAEGKVPVEVVNLRIKATVALDKPQPLSDAGQGVEPPLDVDIFDDRAWCRGKQYTRATIKAEGAAAGPLLVVDPTSTVFVPSGWQARVDAADNLIMGQERAI
jgi:N-methylhydantoinase A